jgi:hypothetical protein
MFPGSRFLDIQEETTGVLICRLERCFDENFGLHARRRETRRRVRLRLKSVGEVTTLPEDTSFRVKIDSLEGADTVINGIDRDLAAIAKRPMRAHEVEAALRITARERIRWTKNGRLRTSGMIMMRRQQIVAINTYAVDDIQALAARPATIDTWRAADGTAPEQGAPSRKAP